jgi:UDP-2,4-diacetamido-2,4,6-trideoxy-beta-L-altropyranose hydrolase
MRCLALGEAWQEAGGAVTFACARIPTPLRARLERDGIEVVQLSSDIGSTSDAGDTVALARSVGATWVAVDGYGFGTPFHRAVVEGGLRLLALDDEGSSQPQIAHLLLNPNLHASDRDYPELAAHTQLLLGSRYAPLRREFRNRAPCPREAPEEARRILVTFGGSDPTDGIGSTLRALELMRWPELEARVVVGPANPRADLLESRVPEGDTRVTFVHRSANLREGMEWCDLAIAAAGSTCWELAFMGVPMIVVAVAENQVRIAESLAAMGAARSVGWHAEDMDKALRAALEGLRWSPDARGGMARRAQELVDGAGAPRVVHRMREVAGLPA